MNVPRWSQQTAVHQYAFQPVCSQDSTCQWQGHTANQEEPPVIGRNGSGCTGRSVSINSHHTADVVKHLLNTYKLPLYNSKLQEANSTVPLLLLRPKP